jgi:hypothetical protein
VYENIGQKEDNICYVCLKWGKFNTMYCNRCGKRVMVCRACNTYRSLTCGPCRKAIKRCDVCYSMNITGPTRVRWICSHGRTWYICPSGICMFVCDICHFTGNKFVKYGKQHICPHCAKVENPQFDMLCPCKN